MNDHASYSATKTLNVSGTEGRGYRTPFSAMRLMRQAGGNVVPAPAIAEQAPSVTVKRYEWGNRMLDLDKIIL